jgi:tRNA nucleotidyltransferase (CCA-adding enzyme)
VTDGVSVPDEVLEIARVLERAGYEAWCVGGAVRDAILGDPHSDFDIATSARPEVVQRLFPRTVPVGIRFGTVAVLDRARRPHEVTTFRKDVETDGRHAVVEYGASLEEDLARRDFTINALAWHPLRGEWRDPFDGGGDLERGVVRAVGDPEARIREDYLRILRGLRFAARFRFRIDPATWAAMRSLAPGLAQLSAERVRDEWFKSLATARHLDELVTLWRDSGAAAIALPELLAAPAPAVERAERDPVLLSVLLCHTPAEVLRRLRASNAEVGRAAAIVAAPEPPDTTDAVPVRRWLARVGPPAADVARLWSWRHGAAPVWASVAQAIVERGDPLTREALAVHGDDLRTIGIEPGPRMGQLLDRLLDRVLEDPGLNTRERLLDLARAP